MRVSTVVGAQVLGHNGTLMPFTEDQHPVGHLRADGEHEPLRVGIRPGTSGRNPHRGDACISQDRIKRGSELPSTVASADERLGQAVLMRRCRVRVLAPRSRFAGFRFPPEVITAAVRWYLRYGLSYRDVEELLAERGIEVDHVTVYRWVQRFTPLLIDAARPCRHVPGDRWCADEI